MGMDVPEILEATVGFLRQIPTLDDNEPIEIPPGLLQELVNAAAESKKELQCKGRAKNIEARVLTHYFSP